MSIARLKHYPLGKRYKQFAQMKIELRIEKRLLLLTA
jgi:hypothetical protein